MFIWAALGASILLALAMLVRLGVFRALPLAMGPRRESEFSVLHFVAAIILYFGFAVMAATLINALNPAATTTAPASPSASQSQPASTSAPAEEHFKSIEPFNLRARLIDDGAKLATLAILVLIARQVTRGGLRGFGLSLSQLPRGILLGIVAFALTFPLLFLMGQAMSLLDYFLHGQRPPPSHVLLQMLRDPVTPFYGRILIVISAAVVAPLVEETVFRGILQTALIRRIFAPPADGTVTRSIRQVALARWLVILVAAVLFTAMHWDPRLANWEHFPILGLLALAMGYTYERTGNLWAAMTLHASFNCTSLALTVLNS